jgi:hypothetical protein
MRSSLERMVVRFVSEWAAGPDDFWTVGARRYVPGAGPAAHPFVQ